MRRPCTAVIAAVGIVIAVTPLAAQLDPGARADKARLLEPLPPRGEDRAAREVVAAFTDRLSTMTARGTPDGARTGLLEHHEIFAVFHARPGFAPGPFDRATVALRDGTAFRILGVYNTDLGFVEAVDVLTPPGAPHDVRLLHVRYAQTGSGAVTEDLAFALDAAGSLVPVPIAPVQSSDLLLEGEYLCCGRFTSFDSARIEFEAFTTRDGRRGITHRLRWTFELRGDFRFDEAISEYRSDFELIPTRVGGREPVESRDP